LNKCFTQHIFPFVMKIWHLLETKSFWIPYCIELSCDLSIQSGSFITILLDFTEIFSLQCQTWPKYSFLVISVGHILRNFRWVNGAETQNHWIFYAQLYHNTNYSCSCFLKYTVYNSLNSLLWWPQASLFTKPSHKENYHNFLCCF